MFKRGGGNQRGESPYSKARSLNQTRDVQHAGTCEKARVKGRRKISQQRVLGGLEHQAQGGGGNRIYDLIIQEEELTSNKNFHI